jgi:hypothetical protein
MKIKITILFSLLSVVVLGQSLERQVIGNAGGHFQNANAQLEWTIGEPVVETITGSSAILTQGFHQTSLSVTAISNSESSAGFNLYPNPTQGMVQVISLEESSEYSWAVYDVSGKLLQAGKSYIGNSAIDLEGYERGHYLIQLIEINKNRISTFKVVKMD